MTSKKVTAKWWQVYAMLPLLAALFLLEMRLPLNSTEHIIAQLGILFGMYGLLRAWLTANQRALMGLDEDLQEPGEWHVRVYEFPPAQLPDQFHQLPGTDIKGVLSTTFELDELEDVTAFPAGSVISYREAVSSKRPTTYSGDENRNREARH